VWDTLSGFYAWVHAHPQKALCFSGGGIRSATFNLGVLQGLARHEIIEEFDYLSTVSGGGYIGGWLSAWLCREKSAAQVFLKLRKYRGNEPLTPEPEQIQHLRAYSNYLTPKLGLLSADTWTLISTYLRNLLLNWIVFIPALAAILIIPRGCLALLRSEVNGEFMYGTAVVGAFFALWAIIYAAFHRPSMSDHTKKRTPPSPNAGNQSHFLIFCFAPLWISAVCITAFWGWLQNPRNVLQGSWPEWILSSGAHRLLMFAGLLTGLHVIGWCLYSFKLKRNRYPELLAVVATGALGGVLLWLGTDLVQTDLTYAPDLEWYVCFALSYFFGAFMITVAAFIGLVSRVTTDEDREWWARMGAWLCIGALAWSLFSTLVLFGPDVLLKLPHLIASLGGISGIATLLLSHSDRTPANKGEEKQMGAKAILPNLALALAAPLFIACLVSAISLGTSWLIQRCDWTRTFHGPASFSAEDITDLPTFTYRLKNKSNPTSSFLWDHLSDTTRDEMMPPGNANPQTELVQSRLVSDLNKIIQTNSLYEASAFSNVVSSLPPGIFRGQPLKGQRLMQVNRLLLATAFPGELARVRFDHQMITHQTSRRELLLLFTALAAIAWFLSRFININKFSLNAVYRNRLIRGYLGASNTQRHPNPFSGFDPADNLCMSELVPRPFHVVNMTLNLVTDQHLAWQQRKAESFTASRLHAGCFRLGYRDVRLYASHQSAVASGGQPGESMRDQSNSGSKPAGGEEAGGLTLGTAVAISGAAASPNSGYHSSPVIAALMTLFNVRLGAWLGNPGKAGNKSFTHRAPRSAFWHVVKEALGLTDDRAPYVYLSDGGHFENLGLYEMVLRRCRFIVIGDAGCDPDCALEDLGNAIRKVRIDLGIPIEIDQFDIASRKEKRSSKYCAIGRIHYEYVDGPAVEPGVLIYIKPALAGNEPRDVFNYKESSFLFPHEPTSDQWFSESQFESYRMLGLHILETMCKGANGDWEKGVGADRLERFKNQTSAYLNNKASSEPGRISRWLKSLTM